MPVLKYFDGSDWEPVASSLIGPTGPTGVTGPTGATGIVQVVFTNKSDTFSVNTAGNTWNAVTGLSASITPASTNSKILVQVSMLVGGSLSGGSPGYPIYAKLKRDSTDIGIGDAASTRTRITSAVYHTNTFALWPMSFTFLDSPATTSSITYSVDIRHPSGATQDLYVNRTGDDGDAVQRGRSISTVTLTEIA
jgi:hypothetical protein